MIQQFEVKDFKGHEGDNTFRLPGLTIISGTNNSGKSSLLQAVYLLTQNRSNRLSVLALNEQLKLGSFSDVLHKEKRNEDTLELAVDFETNVICDDNLVQMSAQFVYQKQEAIGKFDSSTLHPQDNPVLSEMYIDYQYNGEELKHIQFMVAEVRGEIFYEVEGDAGQGYCKLQGIVPEPLLYIDTNMENGFVSSKDFHVARKYLSYLNCDNIKYLKAFRLDDFRETNMSISQDLGLSGEYTAEKIFISWDRDVEYLDEDGRGMKFSQVFDRWTRYFIGEEYRVRSEFVDRGRYKIVVEEPTRGMKYTLDQVGFGIAQLLPVLTLIVGSKKGDVILVENPEVHLHPKLQAHFVDLCIYAMENGRKLMIETHSEHIINRIRLRIKQNPQLLPLMNILFFEKVLGVIRQSEIKITPEGKLDYWPDNFFDQSYYDLLGLIE